VSLSPPQSTRLPDLSYASHYRGQSLQLEIRDPLLLHRALTTVPGAPPAHFTGASAGTYTTATPPGAPTAGRTSPAAPLPDLGCALPPAMRQLMAEAATAAAAMTAEAASRRAEDGTAAPVSGHSSEAFFWSERWDGEGGRLGKKHTRRYMRLPSLDAAVVQSRTMWDES